MVHDELFDKDPDKLKKCEYATRVKINLGYGLNLMSSEEDLIGCISVPLDVLNHLVVIHFFITVGEANIWFFGEYLKPMKIRCNRMCQKGERPWKFC